MKWFIRADADDFGWNWCSVRGPGNGVISVVNVTIVNANFADNIISKMIMIFERNLQGKLCYLELFWIWI